MEIRRKKQYLVAGILTLAVGIACANPLPTRTTGTVAPEAKTVPTDATMPTDMPQYALVCMAGSLNFRSAPGTDQLVEYVFPDGTLVRVMDETKSLPDGSTWRLTEYGWSNERYLCLEAE